MANVSKSTRTLWGLGESNLVSSPKGFTFMKNITGQQFNRLTVLRPVGQDSGRRVLWECLCACGNKKVVTSYSITHGLTKSCGCFNRERIIKRSTTHGLSDTHFYSKWSHMVQRCNNPKTERYPLYGGRGVTIKWKSFEDFRNDMYSSYVVHLRKYGKNNTTIDRINNNGDYSKENCRWATIGQQLRNNSRTHLITYKKETLCLSDWAIKIGISIDTLATRINQYKWSIEKALMTPVRRSRHFTF